MRRTILMPILALLLAGAACDTPAEPRTFSIVGSWTSSGIDSLEVRFTLSETARVINGAGSWLTPTRAMAFRISGAHVQQDVSLLFEFGDGPDVNFHGEFQEAAGDSLTLMAGRLYGGMYRGYPVVFVRRDGR